MSRQSGSRARRRAIRSPTGGCVAKSAASPLLVERVDRVERLGRRARAELDELVRLLEPQQRVGEAVRRLADRGRGAVGDELAPRREQQMHERGRERAEHEQERTLEPAADPAQLDERGGDDDGDRLHEHVPAGDVRELVREHAVELGGRGGREQALADGDRRAAAARARPRARAGARPAGGRASVAARPRAPRAGRGAE